MGNYLVESKKGEGSTFKVLVPFDKVQIGKSSNNEKKIDYGASFKRS